MVVCRTCLTIKVSKDLLDLPKGIEEESKTSAEIMQFSLDIEIGTYQNASTKLCENCFFKIIDIYKFKEQVLKNQEYLKLHSNNVDTQTQLLVSNSSYYEHLDVNLNQSMDESTKFEVKAEIIVKEESESGDFESDDTLLSVIKNIKYEYLKENLKENLPTLQVKKKRGRKKIAVKKEEITKEVCTVCGKRVKNIKAHMALHDSSSEQNLYPCEFCDKEFKSKPSRYKHIQIKHRGIKAHCYICKKDVVNLKSHTLTIHDASSLPCECNICGQRFISPSRLKAHSLSHTKEKPYSCDICNKGFANIHLMSQHKRQVHDKERQHLCQFCSKSFFKKYALQVHLRSHSKEKPYECKICGKWFSSSTVLKNHKQLHATDKKFACKYCDMTFASSKYVYKHMVVHTKEKNYPCKYCGVRFGRSDHRNRHQKTAHENHFIAAV